MNKALQSVFYMNLFDYYKWPVSNFTPLWLIAVKRSEIIVL